MTARLLDVPAAAIRLSTFNPRTNGDTELAGLAASLIDGLAQRPTLVEVEPGVYEVLTGERRVRAALAVGWETIPALVEPPLDPLAAHARRVTENLHRRELHPLDEARALKLDWLNANALALGLGDTAAATLAQAGSVRAGLAAITALLAEAGWSASRPALTQDAYLRSRGLAISKAALRKKLQVLNLSEAAEARLDTAGLTEAGIRAFVRLEADDQALRLGAIAVEPQLAQATRRIVGWVCDARQPRTMRQALAIARGAVPANADDGDADAEEQMAEALPAADRSSTALPDEQAAALVLPLLESAQTLQAQLSALAGVELAQLAEPWGGFARDALATIRQTIQPYI